MLVDAERGGIAVLESLVGDEDDVAIAAVTAAELAVGCELASKRRKASREKFVESVLDALSVEVYDLDVARAHGALLAHTRRTGRPRGAHDLIIAATARARNRNLITADAKGFTDLPGVATSPT